MALLAVPFGQGFSGLGVTERLALLLIIDFPGGSMNVVTVFGALSVLTGVPHAVA